MANTLDPMDLKQILSLHLDGLIQIPCDIFKQIINSIEYANKPMAAIYPDHSVNYRRANSQWAV
jgi:hypothetical protein